MSNHVHLLLTPGSAGAVSRLVHTFLRNYTGLFNGRHGRMGTLWDGRCKACLVDSQRHVLTCSRYIKPTPVRAWIVAQRGTIPGQTMAPTPLADATRCWCHIRTSWRWAQTDPPAPRPGGR